MSFSFRHFNHDHSPFQIISTKSIFGKKNNEISPLPPPQKKITYQKQHLFRYEFMFFCRVICDPFTCHVFAALTVRRSPTNLLSAQDTICYHPRCTTSLGPNPSPVPEKNGSIQLGRRQEEGVPAAETENCNMGGSLENIEDRLI